MDFIKRGFLKLLPFVILGCVPVGNTSTDVSGGNAELIYEDRSYIKEVKTVQLYPYSGKETDIFRSSIVNINQVPSLILSFDLLQADAEVLHAKLVHCNADWSKSWLGDIEIVQDYNEFALNTYTYSLNTRTPYIHYTFKMPRVKVTGNYLIYVYRNGNPNDLLLSKRFVAFEDEAFVNEEIDYPNYVRLRNSHQQIQFSINHPKTNVLNPLDEIKVLIRQNQRWDKTISGLKPTFFKEEMRILEYRHFDGSNLMEGGNEFRLCDVRSLTTNSQRISRTGMTPSPFAILDTDIPRKNQYYSQNVDLNGQYFIANLDRGGGDAESEYIKTDFSLKVNAPLDEPVYLCGELTGWQKRRDNRMVYDSTRSLYKISLLLKQGLYNYAYLTESKDETSLEGSHFMTGNQYEFIIYHRPQGARYDKVIGYRSVDYNMRTN